MIVSISTPQYFLSPDLLHRILLSGKHVILDTVPFEENELSNRCKIKTAAGWKWLNVPVLNKGEHKEEPIKDLKIFSQKPWEKKHYEIIELSYRKSPYFKKYKNFIENLFSQKWRSLLELDLYIYDFIFTELDIKTSITLSSELNITGKYNEQILKILDTVIATTYFANFYEKAYIDLERLKEIKVDAIFQNYKPARYKQMHSQFTPLLSVLDMLLNLGPKTKDFILKGNKKKIKEY